MQTSLESHKPTHAKGQDWIRGNIDLDGETESRSRDHQQPDYINLQSPEVRSSGRAVTVLAVSMV